jgi:4'-phosphopantetheinyl transferase
MNEVILAYSRLSRDLPAELRARWRARLVFARALHLSADPCAQSQSLLGVALACRLLGAASGERIAARQLRYTPSGKPHVPGLPQFSIAHAGEWVVCALALAGDVGVDIEPLARSAPLPAWRNVFDAEEQRMAARSVRVALGIWAAKEAALKAAGAGFAELRQVRVRGLEIRFRGRPWHCRAPRLAPGMIARLVTSHPAVRLRSIAVPPAVALAA